MAKILRMALAGGQGAGPAPWRGPALRGLLAGFAAGIVDGAELDVRRRCLGARGGCRGFRALEVFTAAGCAAAAEGTALSTRLCTVDFSMLVALVVRR